MNAQKLYVHKYDLHIVWTSGTDGPSDSSGRYAKQKQLGAVKKDACK